MESVGQRIRDLRLEKGWTLKELAARCELSTSFLSQVERGLSSVSITSLHIICQALGMTLGEFFRQLGDGIARPNGGERTVEVMKAKDQRAVNLSEASIKYRFLSREFPERQFEIMLGEIPPGYIYPPFPHEGEEFGYVLEGQLLLTIGDETYTLGPGDSYHFAASTPHGYQAEGGAGVRILWVQTLKYFQTRDGIPTSQE
ncbi:MAG: cupin domain-containing protein [Candidatus Bipolaricaulis sp.]|nr:cupin domain-containing protein [Candidatus Bipolaricaulis sp.]MDD5219737.1 cupin domain-containing protein [Candidatus Bipolaricaulis sp.]MDD5645899.1 cupin domain-containing protein [Candidatus Bipolaricaulis sp.]